MPPAKTKYRTISAVLLAGLVVYFLLSPLNLPLYNFLLFPITDKKIRAIPADYLASMPGSEMKEVYFRNSEGLNLHGLLLRNPGTKRVFLLSHGKGNNVYLELNHARFLYNFGSVFMYDYRGFGKSDGAASVAGTCTDALAAYDYLRKDGFCAGDIIAFGQSFGTGVSAYLSKRRPVSAIVFQSGYSSLHSAGRRRLPWLALYPDWMFRYIDLDNDAVVRSNHPPLLAFHGSKDPEIPVEESIELCQRARPKVTLILLPDGGHLAYGANGEFQKAMAEFLK